MPGRLSDDFKRTHDGILRALVQLELLVDQSFGKGMDIEQCIAQMAQVEQIIVHKAPV